MLKPIKQLLIPTKSLGIKQKYLDAIANGTKDSEIRKDGKLGGLVLLKSTESDDRLIVKLGNAYYPSDDFLNDLRKKKWGDTFCEEYVQINKNKLGIYSIKEVVKQTETLKENK